MGAPWRRLFPWIVKSATNSLSGNVLPFLDTYIYGPCHLLCIIHIICYKSILCYFRGHKREVHAWLPVSPRGFISPNTVYYGLRNPLTSLALVTPASPSLFNTSWNEDNVLNSLVSDSGYMRIQIRKFNADLLDSKTNGRFDSCNSCKRLRTGRLHEVHESKCPFVSPIQFIRSKLSNLSARVSGVGGERPFDGHRHGPLFSLAGVNGRETVVNGVMTQPHGLSVLPASHQAYCRPI